MIVRVLFSGRLFARHSAHRTVRMGRIRRKGFVPPAGVGYTAMRRRLRLACISRSVSDMPPHIP